MFRMYNTRQLALAGILSALLVIGCESSADKAARISREQADAKVAQLRAEADRHWKHASEGEALATFLNLNGKLCAEVLSHDYIAGIPTKVTCKEYRKKSGTIVYMLTELPNGTRIQTLKEGRN
jgi:type II secretory pathway pseudopilin PulG